MDKDLIKELHQMNIYLKSIAESLNSKQKFIIKYPYPLKTETQKSLHDIILKQMGTGVVIVDGNASVIPVSDIEIEKGEEK